MPALREQDGYEGVLRPRLAGGQGARDDVLARRGGGRGRPRRRPGFYAEQVEKFVTIYPLAAGPRDATTSSVADAPALAPTRGSAVSKLFGIPVGGLAVVLAIAARDRAGRRRRARRCATASSSGSASATSGAAAAAALLIVVGLMLGTAIIAAALATGDTMSHTIRSSAATCARPDRRGGRREGHRGRARQRQCRRPAAATSREGYADRIARDARGLRPRRRRRAGDRRADRRAGRLEPAERAAGDAVREPTRHALRGFGEIRADGAGRLAGRPAARARSTSTPKGADKLGARSRATSFSSSPGNVVSTMRVKAIVRYAGRRRPTAPAC